MNIINFDLNQNKTLDNDSIICLGKFETLHLGHQEIFSKAYRISKQDNIDLIFMIYPDFDGFKNEFKKQIFPFATRLELLEQYKPNNILLFEPNIKNYEVSLEDFILYLKNKLKVKKIVIGENFKIKNYGDIEILKKHFEVFVIPLQKYNNQLISSTTIKTMFLNDEYEVLHKMLGFNYFYSGRIISGANEGAKIGFPTINIEVDKNLLQPNTGVFASYVTIEGKRYYGATSISTRPVYTDSDQIVYETYIFDFDEIVYGKKAYVEILKKIREIKKYENIETLIKEIKNDIENIKVFFNNLIK